MNISSSLFAFHVLGSSDFRLHVSTSSSNPSLSSLAAPMVLSSVFVSASARSKSYSIASVMETGGCSPYFLFAFSVMNLCSALWNSYLWENRVLQVLLQVRSKLEGRHTLSKLELVDLPHVNSTKFLACLVGQLGRASVVVIPERSLHPFCAFVVFAGLHHRNIRSTPVDNSAVIA